MADVLRSEFVHGSHPGCTALQSNSIKVAGGVGDHSGIGVRSGRRAFKAVANALLPLAISTRELKDGAAVPSKVAAFDRRAVQIPSGIRNQCAEGFGSI